MMLGGALRTLGFIGGAIPGGRGIPGGGMPGGAPGGRIIRGGPTPTTEGREDSLHVFLGVFNTTVSMSS